MFDKSKEVKEMTSKLDEVSAKMDQIHALNQVNGMLQAAVCVKEAGFNEAAKLIVQLVNDRFPEHAAKYGENA